MNCTAYMIFMVLVGGLGTFEGPIIGAIVLFLIQNHCGTSGVWYLVGLGATAILFALLLPRGLWGTVRDRYAIQLLPVGHLLPASPRIRRRPSHYDRKETSERLRLMSESSSTSSEASGSRAAGRSRTPIRSPARRSRTRAAGTREDARRRP